MMYRTRIFLGWVLIPLMSGTGWTFDEVPVGARPAALGEAFTAMADDVNTLYYNTAGLASLYRPEVTAYYARLFPNLSDQTRTAFTFVAGAVPLAENGKWGGLGLGYQEFRVDSLFKEETITLGYGRSLFSDRLAFGVGVKQLTRSFGETSDTQNAFLGNPGNRTGAGDPLFKDGNSKKAFGADLGALYALTGRLRLGMAIANVNQPDLGLAQSDRLPLVLRGGLAYDKTFSRVSLEVTRRSYLEKEADTRFHFGGERQWAFRRFGLLSLRAGGALGSREYRQVNMGAGYEVNGLGIDYVFTMPLGAADDTGNMHNAALSFKFGSALSEDDLAEELREEKEALARAHEAQTAAESEAVFMKEERNKLVNEYATEVERLRAELEILKRAQPTPVVVPAQRVTSAEREQQARERALREYANAYDASMRAYNKLVARGATLTERVDFLTGTLEKYKNKGVDISVAREELGVVKSELAQVSTDYRITMDFYRRTVAQGANNAERLSLLERILKKYAPSGIDLSEARLEIDKISGVKKGGKK
ncbi:MAG: hypothetical protein IPN19_13975 [Elusimicrobia bacterium]|nr:hypothetical protein [Elusimicrobiota bacterium]